MIYRQGAVRRVLKTLAAGEGVAMLIDQHMHSPDAIWVDFFERPAATTSTLAALALRTGAPVIPVFALPLPGGRYRLIYEHAVEPPAADGPDAIREFTQRCTDVLEMYVRRHPELWLWMHRRWRDAPVPDVQGDVPGGACGRRRGCVARTRRLHRRCRFAALRLQVRAARASLQVADGIMRPPRRLVILAPNWLGDAVMALPLRRRSAACVARDRARRRGAPIGGAALRDGAAVCRARSHCAGGGGWRGRCRRGERTSPASRRAASTRRCCCRTRFNPRWLASRAGIPERWGFARDLRGAAADARDPTPARQRRTRRSTTRRSARGLGIAAGDRFARIDVDEADRAPRAALLSRRGPCRRSTRSSCSRLAPPTAAPSSGCPHALRSSRRCSLQPSSGCRSVLRRCPAAGSRSDVPQTVRHRTHRRRAPASVGSRHGTAPICTTLAGLTLAAERCPRVVANDSGAMHLAAAVGAPVVAVFGPTDDRKTSPLRAHAAAPEPIIIATDVWCRPCMLRECPIDHRCMTGVSARRVLDALGR